MENWERQEDRKRSKGKKERKRDGIQTAELDGRDQVTATNSWPSFLRKGETEVDYQVAAPTVSSTPTLHRATIAQQRVRMEGWRQRRLGSNAKPLIERKKKNRLDTHRPSHGRTWRNKISQFLAEACAFGKIRCVEGRRGVRCASQRSKSEIPA